MPNCTALESCQTTQTQPSLLLSAEMLLFPEQSYAIYEAALDHGVGSVEEFTRYLSREGK